MDTSHHCTSCVYSPIICVVELIVGSLILWLENFPLDFQYCIEHLIHKCICQARWRDHSLQHQSIVIWITSICVILDVLWYIHTDTLWYVIIGPQKSDTRRTWTRISTGKSLNPDSCWSEHSYGHMLVYLLYSWIIHLLVFFRVWYQSRKRFERLKVQAWKKTCKTRYDNGS